MSTLMSRLMPVSHSLEMKQKPVQKAFFSPCFQILCKIAYVIPISRKYDAARLLYELIVA